ncbi:MAG: hypothetical protein HW421_1267 [Ignavibacteria bacterium]|nr:hypothetical protein [Ignavibacteria bacterium]
MYASYQINANEIDFDFFQSIKNKFIGKDIEISIMDYEEIDKVDKKTENMEILLKRIKDVEEGKNLIKFTVEEFEQIL